MLSHTLAMTTLNLAAKKLVQAAEYGCFKSSAAAATGGPAIDFIAHKA
jgi:hypothetical protein